MKTEYIETMSKEELQQVVGGGKSLLDYLFTPFINKKRP
ncbi:bacteriocin [Lapidilactobacillus salsurivasis]